MIGVRYLPRLLSHIWTDNLGALLKSLANLQFMHPWMKAWNSPVCVIDFILLVTRNIFVASSKGFIISTVSLYAWLLTGRSTPSNEFLSRSNWSVLLLFNFYKENYLRDLEREGHKMYGKRNYFWAGKSAWWKEHSFSSRWVLPFLHFINNTKTTLNLFCNLFHKNMIH